ncbi:MAG: alpha-L-fucosidase [Phycisphaerae bacterium]|nr:alpha-L-fucosidase [Phycisphaerae bacterium]
MRKMQTILPLLIVAALTWDACAVESPSVPANKRTKSLAQWEQLKYGMFIHYGMSTFSGDYRTSRNSASKVYTPTDLDVRQWVATARRAGMKYAVLTAKHTLGHCLWDSEDYDYDVATSTETTDVVAEFMAACKAESIKPGIYYCVLDIHNEGGTELKWKAPVGAEYEAQIKRHLTELHTNHPDIFEQWIDIPHKLSARQRWDIYRLIKKLNPDCLVIMNAAFTDGTEIPKGAWPTDLTNGERTLPPPSGHNPLQRIDGEEYYVPMEMCETVTGNWFWHPGDRTRSIRHLHYLYRENLRRGANFLLNVSPDTTGQIPADQVKALMDLKAMIDNPMSFRPSVITDAKLKASNVFQNQDQYGPQNAVDNNWATRWATDAGVKSALLEIDLGEARTFDTVVINEGWDRIRKFQLQYELDGKWRTCLAGTLVGPDYEKQFKLVAARRVRLNIIEATDGPTLWEFQLLAPR